MADFFGEEKVINADEINFDDFELEEPDGEEGFEEPEEIIETDIEETKEVEQPKVEKKSKKNDEVIDTTKESKIWDQEQDEPEVENENSIAAFASLFYEKAGFGEFDPSELEEDSLEGFIKHIQNIVENDSKPTYSNEFVAELDDFVKKGGNPKQYFDMYYGEDSLSNIDNVEVQRDIVTRHLKETTKWSDTKIEKHIARLELDEELESEAKEAYSLIQESNKQKREELRKQQEEQEQLRQQQVQENIKQLELTIAKGSAEELGFDLSKKEREEFKKFLFESDSKTGLTGYQTYLNQQKNAELRLALAAFKGLTDQKAISKITEKEGTKTLTSKLNKIAASSTGANKKGTNRSSNNSSNNLFAAFDKD